MQLPNGLSLFESCWAAFKLGAVWVTVNYKLMPAEVLYIAESSGATFKLLHLSEVSTDTLNTAVAQLI